jgi:predicted PurR-regulated permease PerM
MRQPFSSGHDHSVYLERLLIAAAVAILLLFLWLIVDLLVLAFGAVVVAVLLRAIANPIGRHTPLGDRWAVACSVLLIAGVFALVGWLFGAQIRNQFADLAQALPAAWRDLHARIAELPIGDRAVASMQDAASSGTNVVSRVGSLLLALGSAIADFLLIIFGAIFLAAQPDLYRRGLLKLVPRRARPLAGKALANSGRALKLWLLGQLVSMAIIGLLTGLGLWIVGVPSAMALGLIAGLSEIVPYAGPVLASIPGLLIALLQGPETAL